MIPRVLFGFAVAAAVFVPLERLFARQPNQRVLRRGWRSDVLHFLVTGRLVELGLVTAAAVPAVVLSVTVRPFTAPLVGAQPWPLQLVEGVLVGALGAYFGHRWTHTVGFLWRFHRIHHSIEEMDWLAAPRLHPVDAVFVRSVAVLPLLALGFTPGAFGAYLLVTPALALLVHANVRLCLGPLRWVIGSPHWHHWHHATAPEARQCNFAAEFPWIDRCFGTAHFPRHWPEAYGLGADEPGVPAGWWEQLRHPFTRAGQPDRRSPAPPSPERCESAFWDLAVG